MKKIYIYIIAFVLLLSGGLVAIWTKEEPKEEPITDSSFCFNSKDEIILSFVEHKNDGFKIPIVSYTVNGEEIHFIVDTGSNISIIDYMWYSKHTKLFTKQKETYINYVGISGLSANKKAIYLTGILDNKPVSFTSSDLSEIRKVTNNYGLKVIGILGSIFLEENDYIIDYSAKAIYKK